MTVFERDQLGRAVVIIRSGDPLAARQALRSLSDWSRPRVLVALGTLCKEYLGYLVDLEMVQLGGSGEELEALVKTLCEEIPEAVRPVEDVLFSALAGALVPTSPAVSRWLDDDPDGMIVAFLQLSAALHALVGRAPRGLIPPPSAILANCRPPA